MRKFFAATFLSTSLISGALVLVPAFAHAQTTDDPTKAGFQLIPCDGVKDPTDPNSKECDYTQLMVLFNRIVSFLLYLSIPLVTAMIMYTAYTYITANGDTGKIAKAKKMLVPVALGIFWVLAGFLTVKVFLKSFLADNIGGTSRDSFINTFLGN